jgi:hypothetical protein
MIDKLCNVEVGCRVTVKGEKNQETCQKLFWISPVS